ncbi:MULTISPECIES: DoxX family protein [Nonomuraea]|uniref:DoxX family membrane protein n=1 Tax=Nonomuraea mangrovi TaxID=2316207 RepID=A0ABW4STS0_9ACTN
MTKRIGSDLALLVARVMVGIIFIAHGLQKWHAGMDSTTADFTQLGVPSPQLAALFATGAEIIGGAMLVAGLGVRIAAFALLIDMAGAGIFVEARNGIFNGAPRWELVVALAAACLMLLTLGGGRLGVDGVLSRWTATRDERIDNEEAPVSPPVPTGAVILSRASEDPSTARAFMMERPLSRYSPAGATRSRPTPGPDPAHDLPSGPVAPPRPVAPSGPATPSGPAVAPGSAAPSGPVAASGPAAHGTASGPAAAQDAGRHAVPRQAGASEPQGETENTDLHDLRSEVDRLKGELAAVRRRLGVGGQG